MSNEWQDTPQRQGGMVSNNPPPPRGGRIDTPYLQNEDWHGVSARDIAATLEQVLQHIRHLEQMMTESLTDQQQEDADVASIAASESSLSTEFAEALALAKSTAPSNTDFSGLNALAAKLSGDVTSEQSAIDAATPPATGVEPGSGDPVVVTPGSEATDPSTGTASTPSGDAATPTTDPVAEPDKPMVNGS